MSNLYKIEYTSINQLIEDLNRNFAVIENSPLYKGIPGKDGKGDKGDRGDRGSRFFFVNLQNFNAQFPGELTNVSKITLTYVNSKLNTFTSKKLLLSALNTEQLIDGDILVLSNSLMQSYDLASNQFIYTGLAFNEQLNLVASLESKIEDYVKYYVDNNIIINSLTNILVTSKTYGKDFPESNNIQNTQLSGTSVYVPFYPPLTNSNGSLLLNHNYFGYSDSLFPKTNDGTMVIGSFVRYIELLTATLNPTNQSTVSSDYAPGENNIPSCIMLQDTPNNGILIGLKSKQNLRSFASIYKDSEDNLVFKSDSGPNINDSSKLKINKTRLLYEKDVEFGNDLTVINDISCEGKTTTVDFESTNQTKLNNTEISGALKITGAPENAVLVTNSLRNIRVDYTLETIVFTLNELTNAISTITTKPSSSIKIPQSNSIASLVTKLNAISAYIKTDNYQLNLLTKSFKGSVSTGFTIMYGGNMLVNLANYIPINMTEEYQADVWIQAGGIINVNGELLELLEYQNNYKWPASEYYLKIVEGNPNGVSDILKIRHAELTPYPAEKIPDSPNYFYWPRYILNGASGLPFEVFAHQTTFNGSACELVIKRSGNLLTINGVIGGLLYGNLLINTSICSTGFKNKMNRDSSQGNEIYFIGIEVNSFTQILFYIDKNGNILVGKESSYSTPFGGKININTTFEF